MTPGGGILGFLVRRVTRGGGWRLEEEWAAWGRGSWCFVSGGWWNASWEKGRWMNGWKGGWGSSTGK